MKILRQIGKNFFCGLLLFFCHPLLAHEEIDAPRWIWEIKNWNIEKDDLSKLSSVFGPGTNWDTGDAICGQGNTGYIWKYKGKNYFVIFFQGEMGAGFRISRYRDFMAELGYSEYCTDVAAEKNKIPAIISSEIKGNFIPPVIMGNSIKEVMSKLGKYGEESKVGEYSVFSYHWDCETCIKKGFRFGDLKGVQTNIFLKFKNSRLESYQVDRVWGL